MYNKNIDVIRISYRCKTFPFISMQAYTFEEVNFMYLFIYLFVVYLTTLFSK
jgi:hypothetical protein